MVAPYVDPPPPVGDELSVLVADDNPDMRFMLTTWLTTEPGMSVVAEVDNIADTVAAAGRLQPDVVLLDIRLSGSDGIAAIPQIRASAPGCRVVMHSADITGRAPALAAGAHAWVTKGSSWSVLRDEVLAGRPQQYGQGEDDGGTADAATG